MHHRTLVCRRRPLKQRRNAHPLSIDEILPNPPGGAEPRKTPGGTYSASTDTYIIFTGMYSLHTWVFTYLSVNT